RDLIRSLPFVQRPATRFSISLGIFSPIPKPLNKTRLTTVTKCAKISERMSRFPARCCVKEYETILFHKTKSPACSGGNHPVRPRNIHTTLCANHHHHLR